MLKPAPDTPWSGTLLGKLIAEETDIPPGVVNVVVSSDHLVGQQLAEDHRVDVVSFTGSTATGRKVMQAASGNLKKTFLELGGKSAMIVLDDADIGAGVGACGFAVMTHAGQGCAITTRLLLPRSRYDEGVEAVVGLMSALGYGDPTDPENFAGPLISAKQRERVLGYIEKGKAEGAKVALGGGRPAHLDKGFYVEPTVFVDVDPDSTIAQEEIFGPVLAVIPFEDDDDAVRIANNSIYGLSGGVQAGSIERARSVANRIRTGTMSVNGGVYYGADVPFGGYKQSGIGREMGVAGFEEYLEMKTIAEPAALDRSRSGSARRRRPSRTCSGRALESDPDSEYLDVCGVKSSAARGRLGGPPHRQRPRRPRRAARRPGGHAGRELERGDARLVGHRARRLRRRADQHRLQGRLPAPPARRLGRHGPHRRAGRCSSGPSGWRRSRGSSTSS